jgi:hypothetical protein
MFFGADRIRQIALMPEEIDFFNAPDVDARLAGVFRHQTLAGRVIIHLTSEQWV